MINPLQQALIKAGLASEADAYKKNRENEVKAEEDRQRKLKEKREAREFSDIMTREILLRDALKPLHEADLKVLCSSCGREGYPLWRTAFLYSDYMNHFTSQPENHNFMFMLDPILNMKFTDGFMDYVKERFDNVVSADSCTTCKPREERKN